ncbi:MAG TPA: hypothetical protein EYQ50_04650 [Verrucomicrobiales bacterium]|nr:hypothetical protein [Verrucomicrobiales bacterium]
MSRTQLGCSDFVDKVEVWNRDENARDAGRVDEQKTYLQRNLPHPFSFNDSKQDQTADWICHGLRDKGSIETTVDDGSTGQGGPTDACQVHAMLILYL